MINSYLFESLASTKTGEGIGEDGIPTQHNAGWTDHLSSTVQTHLKKDGILSCKCLSDGRKWEPIPLEMESLAISVTLARQNLRFK